MTSILHFTVGNTLSGVIMMKKSLRHLTASLFLCVLALLDNLMLFLGLLRLWLHNRYSIDLYYSNFGCKLQMFLAYFTAQECAWVIVCLTMERLICVVMPHKAKHIATRKNAAILLVVVTIVLTAINAHNFETIESLETDNSSSVCNNKPKFDVFYWEVWPWIDFMLLSILPFSIMCISNLTIIVSVAKSKFQHLKSQVSTKLKLKGMTVILLLVSLMFIFTTVPLPIFLVMQKFWYEDAFFTDETLAYLDMWWAIVVNISYLNNTCNFFLHILSSRRFRKEVVNLFAFPNKVQPVIITYENSPGEALQRN